MSGHVRKLPFAMLSTPNVPLSLDFYRSLGLPMEAGGANRSLESSWHLSPFDEDGILSEATCRGPRPVWADLLVHSPGQELVVAKSMKERFAWRIQRPIPIPGGGMYVTMFDASGL